MFKTEPMEKVRIIAPYSRKPSIIAFMHSHGIIDIRKSSIGLKDDYPAADDQELNELLLKVSGALKLLPKQPVAKAKHLETRELIGKVSGFKEIDAIYSLNAERASLLEEDKELVAAGEVAGYFNGTGIDFSALKSDIMAFKAFLLPTAAVSQFMGALEKGNVLSDSIVRQISKDRSMLFLAYAKDAQINEILSELHPVEIDLKSPILEGTPSAVEDHVARRRSEIGERMKGIGGELSALGSSCYSPLSNYREMLEIELERSGISSKFKRTEETFIVEGWIPKAGLPAFQRALEKFTGGLSYVEILATDELPPTLVKRPAFLKPFDYLMEFFSLPRSDEIDPTWIFIVSFPIFYGFMISDVGYGLASLIFATIITRATDREGLMYNVARVWQLSSVSAIAFGFLSNEYFGFQLNQYFTTFHGLDWTGGSVNSIILLTLAFGISQVSLGLLFGFINNYRKGHAKIAVSKITSLMLVLFGAAAVAGAFFAAFPSGITEAAAALAALSAIATIALSGSEAAELTNLVTHPLSYTRILGFGFASIIISKLIDTAFTPTLSHGALDFGFLLVIFIVLHFLNMILSIFEGVVQGVRLNFIEFFSKFYTGNGTKFNPFSYRRRSSTD